MYSLKKNSDFCISSEINNKDLPQRMLNVLNDITAHFRDFTKRMLSTFSTDEVVSLYNQYVCTTTVKMLERKELLQNAKALEHINMVSNNNIGRDCTNDVNSNNNAQETTIDRAILDGSSTAKINKKYCVVDVLSFNNIGSVGVRTSACTDRELNSTEDSSSDSVNSIMNSLSLTSNKFKPAECSQINGTKKIPNVDIEAFNRIDTNSFADNNLTSNSSLKATVTGKRKKLPDVDIKTPDIIQTNYFRHNNNNVTKKPRWEEIVTGKRKNLPDVDIEASDSVVGSSFPLNNLTNKPKWDEIVTGKINPSNRTCKNTLPFNNISNTFRPNKGNENSNELPDNNINASDRIRNANSFSCNNLAKKFKQSETKVLNKNEIKTEEKKESPYVEIDTSISAEMNSDVTVGTNLNRVKKVNTRNDKIAIEIRNWTLRVSNHEVKPGLQLVGIVTGENNKEVNHISSNVESVKQKNTIVTCNDTYLLIGNSTHKGIPLILVRKYMHNSKFPYRWRKMLSEWLSITSDSSGSSSVIKIDVLKTEDIDNPPSEFIANKMKKNGQKSSNSLRGKVTKTSSSSTAQSNPTVITRKKIVQKDSKPGDPNRKDNSYETVKRKRTSKRQKLSYSTNNKENRKTSLKSEQPKKQRIRKSVKKKNNKADENNGKKKRDYMDMPDVLDIRQPYSPVSLSAFIDNVTRCTSVSSACSIRSTTPVNIQPKVSTPDILNAAGVVFEEKNLCKDVKKPKKQRKLREPLNQFEVKETNIPVQRFEVKLTKIPVKPKSSILPSLINRKQEQQQQRKFYTSIGDFENDDRFHQSEFSCRSSESDEDEDF